FKRLWLIKFDTSGTYKWLKTPEPDTLTWISEKVSSIDMDIDDNGNISWLCQLSKGIYGGTGGFVVNDTSNYILKYDLNGNFQGGIDIEIDGASEASMAVDHSSGNIYLSGNRYGNPLPVGNTT